MLWPQVTSTAEAHGRAGDLAVAYAAQQACDNQTSIGGEIGCGSWVGIGGISCGPGSLFGSRTGGICSGSRPGGGGASAGPAGGGLSGGALGGMGTGSGLDMRVATRPGRKG